MEMDTRYIGRLSYADENVVNKLELKSPEVAEVYSIIDISGDIKEATVNLKCPIRINTSNKHAIQGVLDNVDYQIRQRVKNL